MDIQRISSLSKASFVNDFLIKKQPVIITDGMAQWNLGDFSPEALIEKFGQSYIQVYNDLFDLQTIKTLEDYINDNFGKTASENVKLEYMRWYSKLKDVDFFWADDAFDKLVDSWSTPYFLPTDAMVIPFRKTGEVINSNESQFPYRGLFISGSGARTRLHKDPFNSNAVLCQFYGEKEIRLHSPEQEKDLLDDQGKIIDLYHPSISEQERLSRPGATYETTLKAGEIVLFPSGWFHDVVSASDSISITWNFVHASDLNSFCSFIKEYPDDPELETVRYFLKDHLNGKDDVLEICDFLEGQFTK
ncbi:hypothetical protein HDF26_002170 [Pedobacter cryoconitis]|uniref:JmjC domain-containing protein n=1 Tax=Pedobacter cryoconitis TaxID=188932 RepID=A0A7W8ZJH6_9SPHI|nr:cupin-like domain-containing protein [Pedobacter cryoconitis]MBB5635103.1 hypothetical protein [Pedobacter cryoconitis]MBB6271713.1 hypothetical protein [Pedobacter cryoconitis]